MSDRLPNHLRLLRLRRNPFPPTPDAACYFMSAALERELHDAAHCLMARKGFVLLTGEVGMGKSTFVRRLLDLLGAGGATVSLLFNTFLQGRELLAAVLRDFGLVPGEGLAADIALLNAFLIERWKEGTTCVLVVDDAQNLSLESLELLRLLSNLETGQQKLLQIVLAGQPELRVNLERHEIRQLASRIVSHVRLTAFDRVETARYVDFRLAGSGSEQQAIALAPRAVHALYRRSRGNPRRIHQIMDRCLYGVLSARDGAIGARLVERAAREAGLGAARGPARRWITLAGMVAVLGVLQAAVITAKQRSAPAPAALSTPALVAAQPTPAAESARPPDCLDRATAGLHVVLVRRDQAAVLEHLPGVCIAERGERVLVAWRRQLRAEDLMPGQSHPAVGRLQSVLAEAQLYHAPVDGLFGVQTRQALADYQQRHALPATGLPDELTLLLIDAAIAAAAAPRTAPENAHADG